MKLLAGVVGVSLVASSVMAQMQGEPPGRVGRLAFVDGTVSFHDDEDRGWTKAIVNTPLTTGDALWTEPNSRSEVSLAGTRIRMDGSTELDMSQIDDSRVRLQLAQGRLDVKTAQMDTSQPYEIVTPRGTIALQQQGDYYVEAGSQQDPTRLGVRAGAAQIQGLNGQVLAVRPGEVGEVYGDGSSMQLKTVRAAPPAPAASWAARDRQVVYEQPPQYIPAGMTGYEDLNAYGNWVNDGSYGQVWVPRSTPAGWAPYRTGHWSYVKPWGWTWIDEQPWGFAPYHYGRWANSNNRWVWVPPQREERPVYAPALVAFVGGLELAAQLGNQGSNMGPVGWFPLGPREVYVPPYSSNRDYYQRINRAARIQDRELEERWERAQRREAFIAGQNSVLANQRFATVVPSQAFVRSQPVQRAALKVAADRLTKAAVAPVSAPPAPTVSVASMTDAKAAVTPERGDQKPAPADAKRAGNARTPTADVPVAKTAVADMPTLAKPQAADRKAAPGPKVASTDGKAGADVKASGDNKSAPALRPRQGAAPPALKETDKDEPNQGRQAPASPERGKPSAEQPKEAAPAPRKPELASPDPSPARRDEQRQQGQDRNQPDRDQPKQAAPAQPKPNAAPQPRQEEPKQAAPAPQRPAANPQPRQEEPRQATPQPAPRQEAPRQEAPRQAAPQPRAEPQQQRQEQAQPPRPQPQQQAPQPPQPQQAQPPRQQQQQQPQPQQQQQPQRERETRAPAPQQQQQQQIAQPPQQQPQQQPQQRGNNGGGNNNNNNNKKDKD